MNRFDNHTTDQLRQMDREARDEARAVREALCERLKAECPVKIGKVYTILHRPDKFRGGAYAGRKICIEGIKVETPRFDDKGTCWVAVWGALQRPRQTRYGRFGGTFTSRCVDVPAIAIDLTTESDPVDVPYPKPNPEPSRDR